MNTFKHYILLIAVLVSLVPLEAAAESADRNLFRVTDVNVSRDAADINIDFGINPGSVNPGRDKEVIFTPVIRSLLTADSIVLPSVRICGRNRYYSHLRNKNLSADEEFYNASDRKVIRYHRTVPYQDWMERSEVCVRQSVANCCSSVRIGGDTPVARLDFTPREVEPLFRFVELIGDSAIMLTAEGRAFVDFKVNRTEIFPDYRNNRRELASIISSIDRVKNDRDATITEISIKGFASPDGSYDNNVRLAMGRTNSLKEYVRNHYNFPSHIMRTQYEPEDWNGLRAWVAASDIASKDAILGIIDSDLAPDPKNTEIQKKFPVQYKFLLDSVYPGLRHSDYTVKYRIRTYATVEELLEVFKVHPERLRSVDFQRIAALYPAGSDEYETIMLTAVKYHPYDADANLNAASICLSNGDLKSAEKYLDHAGNRAEAVYTRGVAAALVKDYGRAEYLLKQAQSMGMNVDAQLSRVHDAMHTNSVEYLIEPEKER